MKMKKLGGKVGAGEEEDVWGRRSRKRRRKKGGENGRRSRQTKKKIEIKETVGMMKQVCDTGKRKQWKEDNEQEEVEEVEGTKKRLTKGKGNRKTIICREKSPLKWL